MKSYVLYQLIVLPLVFAMPSFAQVAKTADEVKQLMFTSHFGKIVQSEGGKKDALEVDVIKKILANHGNSLFGGMSDFSKFATLKELCSETEKHPKRSQLNEDLFKAFQQLSILEGEPKNWNEVAVKSEGGALGLVTKSLVAISDEKTKASILDYLIQEDDTAKANLVLEKSQMINKKEGLLQLVAERTGRAKSEKKKNLLLNFSNKQESK